MIYSTRAIVFRTVKYGESSLIADLYTEQKGHQTFIIHSVRKSKATTPASYLQLMSLVELVAYFKEGRKIHHIKEVRLAHPYHSIPFDMHKSAVITCLGEICSKCITTADPHPELFNFLFDSLIEYDNASTDPNFLIRCLAGLTHYLGFGFDATPVSQQDAFFDLQEGQLVSHATSHLYLMSIEDYQLVTLIMDTPPGVELTLPPGARRRLLDQLVTYYQLHVEALKEVNSIKILRELF